MTTIYKVKAQTLNLRTQPSVIGTPDRQVPLGTLLTTDHLTVGTGPQIIGWDDPSTADPAHISRHWAHVIAYTLPDARKVDGVDLYAAVAWLTELFDAPPSPSALTFKAPSRITPDRFYRVLSAAHSPAAAVSVYGIPVEYGLDPAIALAFFKHESSFGTQGKAVQTRNWGNLRRSQGHAVREADGWAWYADWGDSLRDWCMLVSNRYVAKGLTTVDLAIPVYAPSSDNNAPARYIAAIYAAVAGWQA